MPERRRVIVVLGMHRTGTSAFTAGLSAIGVELGDRLLQGGPQENPKGFFEDEWFLDISERLLAELGLRWDSVSLPEPDWWKQARFDRFRLEAREEIARRYGPARCWGFKNPRATRLLPFWQDVFQDLDLDDSYLVTTRNPLSVARSLELRDGFEHTKSHLLWLVHLSEAWRYTTGRRRVFADFDGLVTEPEESLARIAKQLRIRLSAKRRAGLETYASSFISRDLRHTVFRDEDLTLTRDVPEIVRDTFEAARALASDARGDDEEETWSDICRRVDAMRPILGYVERVEHEAGSARKRAGDAEAQAHSFGLRAEASEQRAQAAEAHGRTVEEQRAAVQEARTEDVSRAAEEAREAAAALEHAQTELDRSRGDLERSQGELERSQGELEQSETARGELSRDFAAAAARLDEVRAERERESRKLDRSQELLSDSQRRLARAETRLDATREAQESAASELSETRARLGRVESRWTLASERVSRLQAEVRDQATTLERAHEHALGQAAQHAEERAGVAADLATGRQAAREVGRHHRQQVASLTRHARELAAGLGQMRATRTWRLTRRLQRTLDRIRRIPGGDALAVLEQQVVHFASLCARDPLPEEALRHHIDAIRWHHALAVQADTYRLLRAVAYLQNFARLRIAASGPAELIAAHIEALRLALGARDEAPPTAALETQVDRQPGALVDVLVPICGALPEARRCLESVRASTSQTPYELVVVDDSGGEAGAHEILEAWAEELDFTLLVNPQNQGYVASVNRGVALHEDRDVVLLDSDTVVNGDWIDRLRRAAYGEWRVGTATPFSNDAGVCSYPAFCRANEMPGDEETREIDERAVRVNAGRTATLPTTVGFCTYVRRACLDDVGHFDAERFRAGYGEERDFSMRARGLGWGHVLAADVYVAHAGAASFGARRAQLLARADRLIDELHPRYALEAREFVERDPLRPLRRRIDLCPTTPEGEPPSAMLLVSSLWSGGTERHLRDLADRLRDEGVRVFRLQTVPDRPEEVRLSGVGRGQLANAVFDLAADGEREALEQSFRGLGIGHVHLHHTLGLPHAVVDLPERLGVPYDFTVHDYFSICPRLYLVDGTGRYCGEPEDAKDCTSCVRRSGSPVGSDVDVAAWRRRSEALLAGARRVFVPSEDVGKRLARYFPGVAFAHRPHFESRVEPLPPRAEPGDRLRVAVLGALSEHKGSRVLLSCARDAQERGLPLEFHLFGYSDRDEDLSGIERVTLHGPYDDGGIYELLADVGCDLAFLPSVGPEVYGYTLSIAWNARLHPVAFDHGALGERIRGLCWGELLDPETGARGINDRLLSLEVPDFPAERFEGVSRDYASLGADYYEGVLQEN